MDAKQYSEDLDVLTATVRRQQLLGIVLGIALVLALWNAVNMFGRDRTIVTPPSLERSFWVTSSTASAEYLEQMAIWAASLILDVTPDSAPFKGKLLLQYAEPSAHGYLQERMALESARMKRDTATTLSDVQTLRSVPDKLAVVLTGKLNTFINGVRVTQIEKHYLARFRISSGRAELIEFSEVPHADLNVLLQERG